MVRGPVLLRVTAQRVHDQLASIRKDLDDIILNWMPEI